MEGNIYLINGDKLTKVKQEEFSDEDTFQTLLEDYPDLLAGEQIDKLSPRRWLLVKREMGINMESSSNGRWSIDHFFVDQDGIPTLIEVKRSSDTRIRREVVGQMLDYAANVSYYWKKEKLQNAINSTYENANQIVREFLRSNDENIVEEFWNRVDENLKDGRIRLVFVADQIPLELQRIIEFMNEQMDPTEVLGVELKHFTDGQLKILVPQVIGMTAQKQAKSRENSSKRKPNSTPEELQKIAYDFGVGEIYKYAVEQLTPLFRSNKTRVSLISFKDKIRGRNNISILNLIPQESGENGLHFQLYLNRFTEFSNSSDEVIINILPKNILDWSYVPGDNDEYWSGYCGYFESKQDIDNLVNGVKKAFLQNIK